MVWLRGSLFRVAKSLSLLQGASRKDAHNITLVVRCLMFFFFFCFFLSFFFSFRPSSLTPSKWQEKNRAFWPFSQFLYGILCLKVKCHLLGVTMLAALKNHFTYVERHLSRQMDQFSTAAKKKSSWTSSSSFFLNWVEPHWHISFLLRITVSREWRAAFMERMFWLESKLK